MTDQEQNDQNDQKHSGADAAAVANDTTAVPTDAAPHVAPIRMWALHVPFNKRGFPVLGHSFAASTSRGCIILPVEKWTELCQRIPELAATQFEIGTLEAKP